jgi:hypothetical protein
MCVCVYVYMYTYIYHTIGTRGSERRGRAQTFRSSASEALCSLQQAGGNDRRHAEPQIWTGTLQPSMTYIHGTCFGLST